MLTIMFPMAIFKVFIIVRPLVDVILYYAFKEVI